MQMVLLGVIIFGELIIVTGYKLLLVDLLEEDMQNQEMFIFLMKIDL